MSIESNIIRKNVQNTTAWSGGTTTELWIWPPEAKYAERNFDCRISTAVVEAETSEFTDLPGYKRHLMILEGVLTLQHDAGEPFKLEPFTVDVFDGGAKTISWGQVRDFNVMLREGYKASLSAHNLDTQTWVPLAYQKDLLHLIYCVEGTAQIQVEVEDKMQRHFLYAGDVFFLEGEAGPELLLNFQMKALKGTGQVVHVVIQK